MEHAASNSHTTKLTLSGVVGSTLAIYLQGFFFITLLVATLTSLFHLFDFHGYKTGVTNQISSLLASTSILVLSHVLVVSILMSYISTRMRGKIPIAAMAVSEGFEKVIYAFKMLVLLIVGASALFYLKEYLIVYFFYQEPHHTILLWSFRFGIAILYFFGFLALLSSGYEKTGTLGALVRSFQLIKGHSLLILALIIIYVLAMYGVEILAKELLKPKALDHLSYSKYKTSISIANYVARIPLECLITVSTAYLFFQLSEKKGNIRVERVAKVFE